MYSAEKRIIEWLKERKYTLFIGIISLIGLFIRFENKYFESEDYLIYLSNWYMEIKNGGGLLALKQQVGNYPAVYQALIALFSYLPISPLYAYKGISVIFDYLLAFEAYRFVKDSCGEKLKATLSYAIIILSPIVIMNSATWGQCDSIYTFFLICTLHKLHQKKCLSAFVYYGLAFAFKMQSIFLLPYILYLYIKEEDFSLIYFLLIPLVIYITYIPAFLFGRSLLDPFANYLYLAEFSNDLCMNVSNLWSIGNGDYMSMQYVAMGITLLALGGVLLYILEKKVSIKEYHLELAAWSIWTCVLFLPAMHDRYFYPLEIILIILICLKHKYLLENFVMFAAALQAYCVYLYHMDVQARWIMGLIVMSTYLYYSYKLFGELREGGMK